MPQGEARIPNHSKTMSGDPGLQTRNYLGCRHVRLPERDAPVFETWKIYSKANFLEKEKRQNNEIDERRSAT